ncbi:cytochrome C biogenesis protein CcdA [Epibacterium sp. SM1969]|uniref:Cytochrome c-type biogenesis protein n=1 Tax=Tritonibacter aquimaris TaxID=2663379 RepID=A0A844AWJ9_9RHOB|nr:cytochrome c-type biogenesis protein [Tritonibacter aquimaris]MQY41566.1 cytochrome C biogenesis protein CcdA [Tritonibacter aquimaris]
MKHLMLMAALITSLSLPAWAVEPDEVLDDPALEARARILSKDLRCLVCRNESIDESNAELARDLRLVLRERLVAGDSDTEAMEYLVNRYGEYVLLRPTVSGANWMLWAAGPIMLLIALGIGGSFIRSRSKAPAKSEEALSEDEKARLKAILDE